MILLYTLYHHLPFREAQSLTVHDFRLQCLVSVSAFFDIFASRFDRETDRPNITSWVESPTSGAG